MPVLQNYFKHLKKIEINELVIDIVFNKMATPNVIPQMKYYIDAADYNTPGETTCMIQMKTRLETLEEAIQREKWEQDWAKKCIPKKNYIDKADYDIPGIITSMTQMKSRLETEEETQIREKREFNFTEHCQNLEKSYAERLQKINEGLPENWTAYDDDSKRVYYHNCVTKVSTWTRPT